MNVLMLLHFKREYNTLSLVSVDEKRLQKLDPNKFKKRMYDHCMDIAEVEDDRKHLA